MKLVLASQGFSTNEIAKSVEKLVGKPLEEIHIAIINEAYVGLDGTRDKSWLIKELANIEKYIGGVIDFVNFRAYDKNEINNRLNMADLIYIVGGRQHLLEKLFNETDTIDIMKKIAKSKVIMGTSAGAIVLGRKITSQQFWEKRYPKDIEKSREYDELNLVEFNIIPHYMRKDRIKWTKQFFKIVLSDNKFPVYAIKDTQAVIYNEGKIEFVGGNPELFGNKINNNYN